jgi:cytochrome c oxidase cbb3-type subunit II
MKDELKLIGGGMVMLGLATSALVVLPYLEVRNVPPTPGLKPYTAAELRGREVYIANGCVYCHSQQPRAASFAPDDKRGWGRASVAGDYAYDTPHLLGTMRTGPDLLNIGVRQPSDQWHLGHLYQPRAYVPGSIMPAYPYLFQAKDKVDAGEVTVSLPPGQDGGRDTAGARLGGLPEVAGPQLRRTAGGQARLGGQPLTQGELHHEPDTPRAAATAAREPRTERTQPPCALGAADARCVDDRFRRHLHRDVRSRQPRPAR